MENVFESSILVKNNTFELFTFTELFTYLEFTKKKPN